MRHEQVAFGDVVGMIMECFRNGILKQMRLYNVNIIILECVWSNDKDAGLSVGHNNHRRAALQQVMHDTWCNLAKIFGRPSLASSASWVMLGRSCCHKGYEHARQKRETTRQE